MSTAQDASWLAAPPADLVLHDGLALRRWAPSDLAALVDAITTSRDHLAPWLSWVPPWRPETAEAALRDIIAAWDAGTDFTYGVWEHDDLVGAVGVHVRAPGRLELGYWVHVDHLGRGIARRAAQAATDAAFRLAAVEVVEVRHADTNVRSAGIPAALGFERIGRVARDPASEAGGTDVTVVWELRRGDPPA